MGASSRLSSWETTKLGFAFPPHDQVPQRPVVPLHRRLPGAHVLALEPHQAEVDRDLALRLQLPLGLGTAGVLGQEHAYHTDVAREPDRVDQSVERETGVLVSLGVVCLVADALTAVVGTQTEGGVLDDLHAASARRC